ncbi:MULTISPECIES: nucleotidyltransferase family protein [Parabacteroides]|nr:hypothetical protein [Parabacteroides distasonis]MRZ10070.1 hypothetical protein [Parabacteroides distasonis]RGY85529.1 hypothetical protein DXA21_16775 [Parabacteroides distasonis]RHD02538.1 hypothetical protein DW814_02145 [Parabacteroides distasonis]RHI41506.1 hypothetical protein DW168_01715 [Parabacteroides distasonis]
MEKRNELANNVAPEVFELFSKKGFQSVMMKGQVVATEYAFPLRSESGDIDLYFTEEEGKRLRKL